MKLFAEFIFETETAETIYRALLPELEDSFSERSEIGLSFEDTNKLILSVKAEDVVSLRSALNTWFRLIQIAQEVLGPGVKVVAAFQNVPAHALRKLDEPVPSDVLVCADDLDAAQKVIQLAQDGKMGAYYAGKLANSITVEGLTSLLIVMNKHHKVKNASIGITGIHS